MNIIVIDTETGGLCGQTDALLSIGAVDAETNRIFYSRCRANGIVSPAAIKINGLKDYDSPALKSEGEMVKDFFRWLKSFEQPRIIAGCNPQFDIEFINAAARRNCLTDKLSHRALCIQSLALSFHLVGKIVLPIKDGHPSASLDSILASIGLKREGKYHSALEDAQLTLKAILYLLGRLNELEDK